MINSQSKSLGIKVSSLTKTEANTQNLLNNTNDFYYRLKVRHVVDIYIYIYIYIYIDIVPDVPDTSGESKNNIVLRLPRKELQLALLQIPSMPPIYSINMQNWSAPMHMYTYV